jgi:hypothetical protein
MKLRSSLGLNSVNILSLYVSKNQAAGSTMSAILSKTTKRLYVFFCLRSLKTLIDYVKRTE